MKLIKSTLLAMALFCVPSLSHAQLGDILNKVVSAVTTPSVSANQLEGTWIFTGSAVQLESDNILKKAAGSAISSQAQKKFDNYLTQAGIKEGNLTFTFKSDGTFDKTIGEKNKASGKYTVSGDKLTLTYDMTGISSTTTVSVSGNEFSMLYDADKVLTGIEFIGSKVNNSTVQTITSLLKEYDGMNLGMKFKKGEIKKEEPAKTTTSTSTTKKSTSSTAKKSSTTTKKTTTTKKSTSTAKKTTTTKKTTTKKK
ncbi:MAG: DUF4923 family protein [Bacteroidaceae bacterium]|nr:DUF4923 family protein [Bacteroidaceae bacterium]